MQSLPDSAGSPAVDVMARRCVACRESIQPGEAAIADAARHFDAALAAAERRVAKDRKFAARVALPALLAADGGGVAVRETLRLLNRLRTTGTPVPPALPSRIALIFEPIGSGSRTEGEAKLAGLAAYLAPSELREVYRATVGQLPSQHIAADVVRRYVAGRLAEAAGDPAAARRDYKALLADGIVAEGYRNEVFRPAATRVQP